MKKYLLAVLASTFVIFWICAGHLSFLHYNGLLDIRWSTDKREMDRFYTSNLLVWKHDRWHNNLMGGGWRTSRWETNKEGQILLIITRLNR